MLLTHVPTLDALIDHHAEALGADRTAYRNHTYRVLNFCVALSTDDAESIEKIAVAVVFHDLGIWTHGTFDYLDPSEALARAHIDGTGHADWADEVGAMVREHHKITRYTQAPSALVEAFRKADWVDVTHGLIRCGLPRSFLREVFAAFPNAGFHKRLVQLATRRLLTHPWSPMPMMRW